MLKIHSQRINKSHHVDLPSFAHPQTIFGLHLINLYYLSSSLRHDLILVEPFVRHEPYLSQYAQISHPIHHP